MMVDYFARFRRFVLALSGAHLQTLDLVPTERTRFESLGWAMLITSGMAVFSMWFALASAMGINGILAIPVAIFWGLVILGIDRWLVNSIPIDASRKWAMAAPRVLLAILLGALISTPLVLRVFQSEINAQIAQTQTANYNTYLKAQKNGLLAQRITTYSDELQYLNTVINSHGAATGSTAADPGLVTYNKQLNSLNSQLSTWTRLQGKYYRNYTCQLYGGASCPKKGDGPAARTSKRNYDNATSEIATIKGQINHVQSEIQVRTRELNNNSKSAQRNRYQEALGQRPTIQQEYNTAIQQQNQLQQSYYAQNRASHGILARLEALSRLSDGNFTVTAARFLLFLLFLVIECLPVTVKLLQKPGHYEAALQRARAAESRDVDMFYSSWSGYQGGGPSSAPRPDGRPREDGSRSAEARRPGQGSADLSGIWQPTKVMDRVVGDPEDERGTEVLDGHDRPEFPPSESEPRSARGWRQPAAQGAAWRDELGQGGQSSGDRRDWDDAQEDPSPVHAGPGYEYSGDEPDGDGFQRIFTPPQGSEFPDADHSVHKALYQVEEDKRPSASSDGNVPASRSPGMTSDHGAASRAGQALSIAGTSRQRRDGERVAGARYGPRPGRGGQGTDRRLA